MTDDKELIAMALIDYTDPDTIARQNIAPNAGCNIDGKFYDVRNLVHLAASQADFLDHMTDERDWYMEEWVSAVEKLNNAMDVLRDAESQLVYLDKRLPTGTTPTILTRIRAALILKGESHE